MLESMIRPKTEEFYLFGYNAVQSLISQKIEFFTATAVITSNPTGQRLSVTSGSMPAFLRRKKIVVTVGLHMRDIWPSSVSH
jgi:hypothetical protein